MARRNLIEWCGYYEGARDIVELELNTRRESKD